MKKTKLFSESMTTHYSLVHWLASLINIFIGAINLGCVRKELKHLVVKTK